MTYSSWSICFYETFLLKPLLLLFTAAARRPFPSVLDDISDELLDLNAAVTSTGNPETTSVMTEKLNTNFYPILDICTIEIPDGESLPDSMPILSLDMVAKLSSQNAASKNTTGEVQNSSSSDVFTIDSFPKLHNVHIRHRIPHGIASSTATTTTPMTPTTPDVVTSTTTPRSVTPEFSPNDLTDDDTLEVRFIKNDAKSKIGRNF